jgi:FKBP-type peptidyl-prolyl cis-trans isomerase FkpA
MKKLYFVVVIVGLISFFGCGKSKPDFLTCTNALPFSDSAALLQYAADSSITPTKDNTGLFYQIIDSGSNVKPYSTSHLMVNYVGRFMNGALFDSASNSDLMGKLLNQLIIGWQIGLPKIGVGGHIKLLIPSAYGWGCTGLGPIPPNAPVYFDVKLLAVN